ncbi:hypothetical protein [Paenibacillus sp. BC26]|uniref:hypothetical protein n=1 Tax=Paenibacillus sp. BC26 TaxID=1881032 RepID=UPI000B857C16|nr:hypothetical protein [Paenibacillus sp. BC26]
MEKVHGNCKLTDEEIREIYRRAHAGEKQTALSREFGISQPHVRMIKNRVTRKAATDWKGDN